MAKATKTAAPARGRIAVVQEKLLPLLKRKNGVAVDAAAETIGCPPRDIRLAIDRMRTGGKGRDPMNVKRTEKGVFAL